MWLRSLALPVCLVLAGMLAWFASRTPAPEPPNAPDAVFSAGRAFIHVQAMAEAPHPLGSPENQTVRGYVLRQFASLGLQTSEHPGHAVVTRHRNGETLIMGGDVMNVVAVLPGRDRDAPALAVMSHYDSAAGSPGAADDAAGVATAMEVARAMAKQPQPERDVIFLVTDGEEAGLLGARAFFEADPMARRIGAVLNMEARGGGGRVFMFQTAPQNGAWIDLLRRAAWNPSSNSLSIFLYSLMPNDTDFTVSMAHGKPGLNFAFIGRQFDYHAPSSTPANLDRGSLQHMGDQVLAATRAAASGPALPPPAPDAVYADIFGGPVIAYPAWAGWLVLAGSAVLIVLSAWKVRPRRGIPWRDFFAGVGAAVYLVLTCVAVFELVRRGSGSPFGFFEQRPLLARFAWYEAALALGALGVALFVFHGLRTGGRRIVAAAFPAVVGVVAGLIAGVALAPLVCGLLAAALAVVIFRRPLHPWWAWFGMLAFGLVLGAVAQALAPGAAFLIHWPLLAAGVLLMIIQRLGKGAADSPPSLLGSILIGAAALGWLVYLSHAIAVGVGADLPGAPALLVLLAVLVLFPLLYAEDLARVGAVSTLLAAVALIAFIRFVDPSSPRHPRVTHALFVADPATNRAWRATQMRDPDPWTRSVLAADGAQAAPAALLPLLRRGVVATAKPATVLKPYAAITREPTGRVVVRLDPSPGARDLILWLRSAQTIGAIRINGIPVTPETQPGGWTRIQWANSRGGLEVVTTPPAAGAMEARWAVIGPGWPKDAKPLPPRPQDAAAWDDSDSTAIIGSAAARW